MFATFIQQDMSWFYRVLSLSGLLVFIAIAWVLSVDRKNISWKTVIWGVALQFIFAAIVLQPSMQKIFFTTVSGVVKQLLFFAEEGGRFIFGALPDSSKPGTEYVESITLVDLKNMSAEPKSTLVIGSYAPSMRNIAFLIILPTIIFFSSLMSVLYHMGIMQRIVFALAWVMKRTMGTTGPESLSAAANIFVGQTEAPLMIKPYIEKMHRSELHAVMTGGFATVAGGIMAIYVAMLESQIPNIAGHLVAASIISAPAALAVSKIMWPMPAQEQEEETELVLTVEKHHQNVVEAAAMGASEGMKLVLNVLAMLVAFVGLIAMINWGLNLIPMGGAPLSLERILGWIFSPLAFCMGVPWDEAPIIGKLLGEKLVLTEFIAYLNLAKLSAAEQPVISERSAIIASYALCGFANFASIGIQIGGTPDYHHRELRSS